jgi:hypothetical protein
MTVPQIGEVFRFLLQPTPPSCAKIAKAVSRVLRRTTEARIYHCYAATKQFPPLRGKGFR